MAFSPVKKVGVLASISELPSYTSCELLEKFHTSRHTVTQWHQKDYGPHGPASNCLPSQHKGDLSPSDQFISLPEIINLRRPPLSHTKLSTGASLPYQRLQPHRPSLLRPLCLAFFTRLLFLPRLHQSAMFSIAWYKTNLVCCRVCLEFWLQEASTLTVWSSAVPR